MSKDLPKETQPLKVCIVYTDGTIYAIYNAQTGTKDRWFKTNGVALSKEDQDTCTGVAEGRIGSSHWRVVVKFPS